MRFWFAHRIYGGAFPIRIRYTYRSCESIHCMYNQVTLADTFVANLLQRFGESGRATILAQSNHAVAEARDHFVAIANGSIHIRE